MKNNTAMDGLKPSTTTMPSNTTMVPVYSPFPSIFLLINTIQITGRIFPAYLFIEPKQIQGLNY